VVVEKVRSRGRCGRGSSFDALHGARTHANASALLLLLLVARRSIFAASGGVVRGAADVLREAMNPHQENAGRVLPGTVRKGPLPPLGTPEFL